MTQSANPGRTGRRWLLVAPALLGVVVVVYNAAVQIVDRLPQPIAAQLPQPSPASGIALLRARLERDGTAVPGLAAEPDMDRVQFLNRRLPLNPVPYVWEGNRAFLAGEEDRGAKLYELARQQDPRSTPVRFALARYYLANGRMEEAAREIFSAAELRGSSAELMMSVVRVAGDEPEFRSAVLDIVAEKPQRAGSFYRYLQNEDVGRPLSLAMIRRYPPTGSSARRILPSLVRAGHVDEALSVWRSEEGLADDAGVSWPQNAGFSRDFANGIFSWRDVTEKNGRVARVRPSAWGDIRALAVTYSGGKAESLLRQTAAMPAGRYRWAIPYRIDLTKGEDIALEWVVRCTGGRELASAKITPDSPEEGQLRLTFSVPRGGDCKTQDILLRGISDERLADLDVQFLGFESVRRTGQ